MIPLILSLVIAGLFTALVGATYGIDALVATTWAPTVFAGLLVSGATLYILSRQAES